MKFSESPKELIVWLSLFALTILSWWLGEAQGGITGHDVEMVTTAIMLLGFFKVRLVGMYFMELRVAPAPLRLAFDAWVVIACAAILVVYWQVQLT
jgi:hypothetical protein